MNKIIFYPKSKLVKEVVPPPNLVSVPDWYKKLPMFQVRPNRSLDKLDVEEGFANYSVKACMPFLDTFTTGYTLNTWCDIQVKVTETGSRMTWGHNETDLDPVETAPNPGLPIITGFSPFVFSWRVLWGIKTPPGYSCLFTHPLNRFDLPFITTSGVMDTDRWGLWGTQPFSLKEGWEGVIPAGTPFAQFVPFKRESWKSEIDTKTDEGSLSEWGNYEYTRRNSKFRGYYKNNYWSRKEYK